MKIRFLPSIYLIAISLTYVAHATAAGVRYVDPIFKDAGYNMVKDLVYGRSTPYVDVNQVKKGPLTDYKLDIYTPKGDTAINRAAIVIVHGGGYTQGDKGDSEIASLAREYVKRGYVAVSINYRLMNAAGSMQPGPVMAAANHAKEDLLGAIRFLRLNAQKYGVDPGHIGVAGHSAGGGTVLNANFSHKIIAYENSGGLNAKGEPLASSEFSTGVAIGASWLTDITMDDRVIKVIIGSKDYYNMTKMKGTRYTATELMMNADKATGKVDLTIVWGAGHSITSMFGPIIEFSIPWLKTHLVDASSVGLSIPPRS